MSLAGGDPCVLIARGDPSRKIEFPEDLREVAVMQENRWIPKRTCATWPRYIPPDPDEPEHKQYVQFREWAARKKAWTMACQAIGRWERFKDMDDNFFLIKDPTPKDPVCL